MYLLVTPGDIFGFVLIVVFAGIGLLVLAISKIQDWLKNRKGK